MAEVAIEALIAAILAPISAIVGQIRDAVDPGDPLDDMDEEVDPSGESLHAGRAASAIASSRRAEDAGPRASEPGGRAGPLAAAAVSAGPLAPPVLSASVSASVTAMMATTMDMPSQRWEGGEPEASLDSFEAASEAHAPGSSHEVSMASSPASPVGTTAERRELPAAGASTPAAGRRPLLQVGGRRGGLAGPQAPSSTPPAGPPLPIAGQRGDDAPTSGGSATPARGPLLRVGGRRSEGGPWPTAAVGGAREGGAREGGAASPGRSTGPSALRLEFVANVEVPVEAPGEDGNLALGPRDRGVVRAEGVQAGSAPERRLASPPAMVTAMSAGRAMVAVDAAPRAMVAADAASRATAGGASRTGSGEAAGVVSEGEDLEALEDSVTAVFRACARRHGVEL